MGVVMSRHAVDAGAAEENAAAVSIPREDLTDLALVPQAPSWSRSPFSQPPEFRSAHHVAAAADAESIPKKRQGHRLEPARGVETRSAAGTGKREARTSDYSSSGTAGQVDKLQYCRDSRANSTGIIQMK